VTVTDIPLVPSLVTGDPDREPNFILHWLNNKEMHFSLQAENILQVNLNIHCGLYLWHGGYFVKIILQFKCVENSEGLLSTFGISCRRRAQTNSLCCLVYLLIYRGACKSVARPGRKQAWKHVRDTRDFNKIETQVVIKFLFLQGKALKKIHTILTETLSCFLPGRAKDLSAPLNIVSWSEMFI